MDNLYSTVVISLALNGQIVLVVGTVAYDHMGALIAVVSANKLVTPMLHAAVALGLM